MRNAIVVLLACVALLIAPCASADPVTSPEPTSAEGQAILTPALTDLTTQLGKQAKFDDIELKASQGWAFLHADIKAPDGSWIDYSGTPFATGNHSKSYVALLHNEGSDWKVTTSRVGPSDVAWGSWSDQYGAPAAIFPAT